MPALSGLHSMIDETTTITCTCIQFKNPEINYMLLWKKSAVRMKLVVAKKPE